MFIPGHQGKRQDIILDKNAKDYAYFTFYLILIARIFTRSKELLLMAESVK
jgi:hypothetical protein